MGIIKDTIQGNNIEARDKLSKILESRSIKKIIITILNIERISLLSSNPSISLDNKEAFKVLDTLKEMINRRDKNHPVKLEVSQTLLRIPVNEEFFNNILDLLNNLQVESLSLKRINADKINLYGSRITNSNIKKSM